MLEHSEKCLPFERKYQLHCIFILKHITDMIPLSTEDISLLSV